MMDKWMGCVELSNIGLICAIELAPGWPNPLSDEEIIPYQSWLAV